MKLLKYLKGFKIAILSLVVVLGVRVVAELALPTYTSNIVDTGIQQSGIEDAVPSKISEKSLNTLELFMSDDEIKQVTENYTKDGNTYILNNVSDETRMKLNNIFKETMTVVLGAKSNNTDLNQIAQGVQAGVVSKDTLTDQRKKVISELGNSADMMTKQVGTDITVLDNENIQDDMLSNVHGTLKFEDVSFTFDGADSPVLSNITFEAEAGKTTAIIGSTGSGKSTLLHLIPRYFDATAGRITIDGVDIRDVSMNKLRNLLGFVPQKGVYLAVL